MNWQFWKKTKSKEDSGSNKPAKPKSKAREWWDAILFAVIAATLIRWLIMEAYTIPTPSMENSLLVGDFLFVSKFHYGTRTTSTPLQVPLTHQKIWFTEIPSYSDAIKLPQYRLPGFTEVKREDVVVFNIPPRSLNEDKDYPVDLKTNYIKRCVGVPGDTLVIRNQEVFANGKPLSHPPEMQFSYLMTSTGKIRERNFEKLGLGSDDYRPAGESSDGKAHYHVMLTEEGFKSLNESKPSYILSITKESRNEQDVFPFSGWLRPAVADRRQGLLWSQDNFGPLWIPKAGTTIPVNDSTLTLYGTTILTYDLNDDAKIENGKLFIDGKEVTEYTFNQDYYFMMGDNRHNSLDSRYWGFVPADHIVGKAFFIWLSLDKDAGFFNKIRWSRFFKMIE
jgi:signal peptidase I